MRGEDVISEWINEPRVIERFWSKVAKSEGCWEWTAYRNASGYGVFSFQWRGAPRTVLAHRLSMAIHDGRAVGRLCVCHSCDNPACVRPSHTFLGSVADNNADMLAKGRQVRGEAVGNAILNADLVRKIRLMLVNQRPCDVARATGVHRRVVCDIGLRKRWAHVK